jgi:hypothetical protein
MSSSRFLLYSERIRPGGKRLIISVSLLPDGKTDKKPLDMLWHTLTLGCFY